MRRKKIVYLTISLVTLFIGVVLTRYYRPYVYAHDIVDFGFADVIGSLIAVPVFCFLIWSMVAYTKKEQNTHIILMTLLYGYVWELMGLLNIHGTFDWKDIVVATASGVLTYFLKEHLEDRFADSRAMPNRE